MSTPRINDPSRVREESLPVPGAQLYLRERSVAEAVLGARLVELSDCGHFAYLERPAEVLNAITDYFSQC